MRIDDANRDLQAQEAAKTDAARRDARIEALRLQLDRGEYLVSSQDVASRIIDEHLVDETTGVD